MANLSDLGLDVWEGSRPELMGEYDLVVASSAVPDSDWERRAAAEAGVTVWDRPQLLAADLVAVRLMGFDERRIPKIRAAMDDEGPRITSIRDVGQVQVFCEGSAAPIQEHRLDEIENDKIFVPHQGWRKQIERISG